MQENQIGLAQKTKSLSAYTKRNSLKEGDLVRVYKSEKAWRDGFDFTLYDFINGKLKKSSGQPIASINRIWSI
jgi:hypothetical protein